MTDVTWYAARAYCAAQGRRLPTTAEWEYVAAADEWRRDATRDPAFSARLVALYTTRPESRLGGAGERFRNVYGVSALHGVVWEWTSDFDGGATSTRAMSRWRAWSTGRRDTRTCSSAPAPPSALPTRATTPPSCGTASAPASPGLSAPDARLPLRRLITGVTHGLLSRLRENRALRPMPCYAWGMMSVDPSTSRIADRPIGARRGRRPSSAAWRPWLIPAITLLWLAVGMAVWLLRSHALGERVWLAGLVVLGIPVVVGTVQQAIHGHFATDLVATLGRARRGRPRSATRRPRHRPDAVRRRGTRRIR